MKCTLIYTRKPHFLERRICPWVGENSPLPRVDEETKNYVNSVKPGKMFTLLKFLVTKNSLGAVPTPNGHLMSLTKNDDPIKKSF